MEAAGLNSVDLRNRVLAQQRTMYEAALQERVKLEVIDGGYRLPERGTETHHIDVIRAGRNWLVRETRKEDGPYPGHDRTWRYAGAGIGVFAAAVNAVLAWDGSAATEPAGYDPDPGRRG